ncbi:MAG: sigma-70 family RNA polymerase sigma factor [Gammaproteobacteria bacterium]|nr:sigma-70 family RNA polymerase sigma factor [Gammaproteobacteria bacterium]
MRQETDHVVVCEPEKWLDRHGDELYRHAYFRIRDATAAEDLVQETLLAAWRARAGFRGASQERTWLYGILEHKIQDHNRRKARTPILIDIDTDAGDVSTDEAAFAADGSWAVEQKSWGCDPQDAVERTEFHRALQDCLEGLPENQRTAFVLREWHGEDMSACATVLAVTLNHLSVLLHRARLQLALCLGRRFA